MKQSALESLKNFVFGSINFICATQHDFDVLMEICELLNVRWKSGARATAWKNLWKVHCHSTVVTTLAFRPYMTHHESGGEYDREVNTVPNIRFSSKPFEFINLSTLKAVIK